MGKYNIRQFKEIAVSYQTSISPEILDELYTRVVRKLLIEKRYMLKNYTAKQLAEDLETNSRYISAVCNTRFHMNYSTLINKYRIEEAMSVLIDRRYLHLNMEDISDMVGFANRQSFYAAFYKQQGCTPRDYRMAYLEAHPEMLEMHTKKKETKNGDAKKKEACKKRKESQKDNIEK